MNNTKSYVTINLRDLEKLLNFEEDMDIFGLCIDNGNLGIFIQGQNEKLPNVEGRSVVDATLVYSRDKYGNPYLQKIERLDE